MQLRLTNNHVLVLLTQVIGRLLVEIHLKTSCKAIRSMFIQKCKSSDVNMSRIWLTSQISMDILLGRHTLDGPVLIKHSSHFF